MKKILMLLAAVGCLITEMGAVSVPGLPSPGIPVPGHDDPVLPTWYDINITLTNGYFTRSGDLSEHMNPFHTSVFPIFEETHFGKLSEIVQYYVKNYGDTESDRIIMPDDEIFCSDVDVDVTFVRLENYATMTLTFTLPTDPTKVGTAAITVVNGHFENGGVSTTVWPGTDGSDVPAGNYANISALLARYNQAWGTNWTLVSDDGFQIPEEALTMTAQSTLTETITLKTPASLVDTDEFEFTIDTGAARTAVAGAMESFTIPDEVWEAAGGNPVTVTYTKDGGAAQTLGSYKQGDKIEWIPTAGGEYTFTFGSNEYQASFHVDTTPGIFITSAKQRWPWNGMVDIGYFVEGLDSEKEYTATFYVTCKGETKSFTLAGIVNGNATTAWDAAAATAWGKTLVKEPATVSATLLCTTPKAAGVCEVNGVEYATFEEAAAALTTDGATIYLLKDISDKTLDLSSCEHEFFVDFSTKLALPDGQSFEDVYGYPGDSDRSLPMAEVVNCADGWYYCDQPNGCIGDVLFDGYRYAPPLQDVWGTLAWYHPGTTMCNGEMYATLQAAIDAAPEDALIQPVVAADSDVYEGSATGVATGKGKTFHYWHGVCYDNEDSVSSRRIVPESGWELALSDSGDIDDYYYAPIPSETPQLATIIVTPVEGEPEYITEDNFWFMPDYYVDDLIETIVNNVEPVEVLNRQTFTITDVGGLAHMNLEFHMTGGENGAEGSLPSYVVKFGDSPWTFLTPNWSWQLPYGRLVLQSYFYEFDYCAYGRDGLYYRLKDLVNVPITIGIVGGHLEGDASSVGDRRSLQVYANRLGTGTYEYGDGNASHHICLYDGMKFDVGTNGEVIVVPDSVDVCSIGDTGYATVQAAVDSLSSAAANTIPAIKVTADCSAETVNLTGCTHEFVLYSDSRDNLPANLKTWTLAGGNCASDWYVVRELSTFFDNFMDGSTQVSATGAVWYHKGIATIAPAADTTAGHLQIQRWRIPCLASVAATPRYTDFQTAVDSMTTGSTADNDILFGNSPVYECLYMLCEVNVCGFSSVSATGRANNAMVIYWPGSTNISQVNIQGPSLWRIAGLNSYVPLYFYVRCKGIE